ncbi:hypothetical protein GCM10010327_04770 [Streptomyces nitrosporeus]|nr:hypothetical protein GCM10010327_04770 [Streptomyces nitrosporeus]
MGRGTVTGRVVVGRTVAGRGVVTDRTVAAGRAGARKLTCDSFGHRAVRTGAPGRIRPPPRCHGRIREERRRTPAALRPTARVASSAHGTRASFRPPAVRSMPSPEQTEHTHQDRRPT